MRIWRGERLSGPPSLDRSARRSGNEAYRLLRPRFREPLRGTFPPALLASDSPIAIACLRLVTFFPDRPDRRVPLFLSRIALSTFCPAFFPYFAIGVSFDHTHEHIRT